MNGEMIFNGIALSEILEHWARTRPKSVISQMVAEIGVLNVARLINGHLDTYVRFPALSAFYRASLPLAIEKALGDKKGEEYKEALKALSKRFGISKNILARMRDTGKYISYNNGNDKKSS